MSYASGWTLGRVGGVVATDLCKQAGGIVVVEMGNTNLKKKLSKVLHSSASDLTAVYLLPHLLS